MATDFGSGINLSYNSGEYNDYGYSGNFVTDAANRGGYSFSPAIGSNDSYGSTSTSGIDWGDRAAAGASGLTRGYNGASTDSTGSVLGGAASGASAGEAFGPWGAVIGGVIGAIGGYFGSKSKKKQAKKAYEQAKEMELMKYRDQQASKLLDQQMLKDSYRGWSQFSKSPYQFQNALLSPFNKQPMEIEQQQPTQLEAYRQQVANNQMASLNKYAAQNAGVKPMDPQQAMAAYNQQPQMYQGLLNG